MEFRAQHILVKDKDTADKLYERIRKGENFSSLAHQYSTCPSKEKGGDLGWFKEGQMVREFENAVRRMGMGKYFPPGQDTVRISYYKEDRSKGLITIYTDGGCSGNPGPGGWAFAVSKDGAIIESHSGGDESTTNNKMELTAVINALKYALGKGENDVTILTDSQYVKNGITEWIKSWKRNGWRTSSKAPVKNIDYWVELDSLNSRLTVTWSWVKGHAGIDGNEECDRLVRMETAKFIS